MDGLNLTEKHQSIAFVSEQIKNQKIGVVPTDTLFALTGDARSEEVAMRIFNVKKRMPEKSFPIFVPSLDWLLKNANLKYLNLKMFLKLAYTFWPGPLTVVSRLTFNFNLSEKILHDDFIAIRIVSHPVIMKIFEEVNFPIIGTSANISGKINPLTFDEIDKDVLENVDFCSVGELIYYAPSTVLKLDKGFEILREGVIKESLLKKVLEN